MTHDGHTYVCMKQALTNKFEMSLSHEEQSVSFDLRWRVDLKKVYERLQEMTNIRLSERVMHGIHTHIQTHTHTNTHTNTYKHTHATRNPLAYTHTHACVGKHTDCTRDCKR